MKKKAWLTIIISILVIIICLGFFFRQEQKQNAGTKTSQNRVTSTSYKAKTSNNGAGHTLYFSKDEWMLMGYMDYARDNYAESRHVKSTSALIEAVSQDLNSGALNCEKSSSNSYSLSNGFGSVNVKVDTDNVKVTGDGTTINSKSELAKEFHKFKNKINRLTVIFKQNEAKNKNITASKQNSTDSNFNQEELMVATWIDNIKGSNINNKIHSILNTLAKGTKIDIEDYMNGFYFNKGKPGFSFNASTSSYCEFDITNLKITEEIINQGHVLEKNVSNKETIEKKYQPYRAQIDQIIAGLKENKKHTSAYFGR